ncbi:MAG: transglutaminase domain-containing protein [Bacteroidales bacterium]|nr:transglutaminase domain-containing protein [Bacteroidales bacterium]
MKKIVRLLATLTFVFGLSSCNNEEHFITDKNYREQVELDYSARTLTQERTEELSKIMADENISLEEKEALKFLYAYMPLSDIADYSAEFFLDQVKGAFRTKETFSWGKTVPEDIFRHFVLVYRVNNENLDSARNVFFNELKDRIKDMNMYDAALEVNHWCHEKVTYRPSCSRTSAPLATMRTSLGRCGEESTFTVTAMRSVGIPARQCYTPRWAHTDDNHAWVEVWIDGKWYYLGACEPDAKLNMGWFSIPATRCMMVHSNAFGKFKGKEEVNYQTNLFSKINMLSNYTDTKKIEITVVDNNNQPIENADVKFKLYNYAEYYPIASRKTDKNGKATLTTGLGDLLIWASNGDAYNYAKIDVRTDSAITIATTRVAGKDTVEYFDIYPPKEGRVSVEVTEEETAQNNARLHYEDSVRNAYTSTFPKQDDVKNIVNENLNQQQLWEIVAKSEGNYKEIIAFIQNEQLVAQNTNFPLYDFMKALSEKDLRDCEAATLENFIIPYNPESNYSFEVYKKGIMPARIANELIRPYHQYLKENLNIEEPTPPKVRNWILENITIDDDGNYYNCPISAKGVYNLKISDKHSRNIFFVAACRALDIPAYLDNATNLLFAYSDGQWKNYSFEEEQPKTETGKLVLNYTNKTEIKPEYWIHYTIAKFENGDFTTFDFENDPRVANFPVSLDLEPGYYMLSTGNRYSDGTTLSKLVFFNIEAGKTTTQNIELRTLVPRKEIYGKVDLNTEIIWNHNNDKTIADCVKEKDLVLCFIDPNREPTRHLVNDLVAFKTKFEQWNGTMVFLVPTSRMTKDFNAKKLAKQLPANAIIIEDKDSQWMNDLLEKSDQYFRDNYPLVFIVNKDGNLILKTEGYRIGTGELIYKTLER